VGTASSFGEAGVLAPVALYVLEDVAYRHAGSVIPGLDIRNLRWQPLHAVFYWRRVWRVVLFQAVALSLVMFACISARQTFVGLAICGPLLFLGLCSLAGTFLAAPENGYAITDDAVVVRMGYLHQTISAVPISRIENVRLAQPFWWRKRGVTRLTVQAMRNILQIPALPESAARDLMGRWEEKISQPATPVATLEF
jgi:putative membrane protein